MQELVSCPICASEDSLLPADLILTDHSLTGESFRISRCQQCEAYLTNPRPDETEIGRYYAFPDYVSHSDDAPGLINRLYRLARTWTTSRKLALIERVSGKRAAGRSLLDYGCGTGFFLNAAANANWHVAGVEVSELARAAAQQRIGQSVATAIDDVPPTSQFDVITLWHVLEHIHELNRTVAALLTRLKPDGTLVIAVPNRQAKDAKLYGSYWAAYDVPRHLYHFTPSAIRQLMSRHGAEVVEQIGQPLDAFYIGLLSEKYRKGQTMTGLFNGLRSTANAWKTGEYSSLIYVVKRVKAA